LNKRFLHRTAGLIAGGVLLCAVSLPAKAEVPDHRVWQFYYGRCTDAGVRKLVGMTREKALLAVGRMNLSSYRLLDPKAPVNFEAIPSRLTMVVGTNDVIQRAFCR
jgi:hypothetical protein